MVECLGSSPSSRIMPTDRRMNNEDVDDVELLYQQIVKGINSVDIKGKHKALLQARDIAKRMKNER